MDYRAMNRAEILAQVRQHFQANELVCKHTYAKYGDRAWQFLDTEALRVLLILRREVLRVPLVCNAGQHSQRGLRCNLCELVKSKTLNGSLYLSQHVLGRAFDLTAKTMTAEQMRKTIEANADKFPVPIRVEDDVTWLHVDVLDNGGGKQVYRFKA